MVTVPGTAGDFGIVAGHVPTIACLRPGVVTVDTAKFFVSSGTVTVNPDSTIDIVAEEAATLDQLDAQAAKAGLDQFVGEFSRASNDLERAKAEIGIDVYRAMTIALGSN